MSQAINLVIYPVADIAQAKTLFQEFLGVEPVMDAPYYVQFQVGEQQIGLDPNGHTKGLTGPVGYREVDDIKASLQRLLEAGAQPQQDVQDVGGGKLTALVKDGSGNILGLMQAS
jgi:predicted enzyme related to lactoylglutathione lyase